VPVHRETLIAQDELERAEARLADAVERVREEVLARDVEEACERLDELRERADELESTLLRVRR
jgi:tetrahydromethanopterin S-methyltransferase subunit B